MHTQVPIETLIGKTLSRVYTICSTMESADRVIFITKDSEYFSLYHQQDCCESVCLEDICGDLDDLVNSPILTAEKVSSEDTATVKLQSESWYNNRQEETNVWTFIKIGTKKGSVTIRFYGSSNGYYSEDIDLFQTSDLEDLQLY